MKLTCRLIFNPNARLRSDGTGQIALYLCLNGRKRYIDTGFTCTPKQWNAAKEEIRGDSMANIALRAIKSRANTAYSKAGAIGAPITLEALAEAATGKTGGK